MRLRYADERDKAYRILGLTSLTVEEFEQFVPVFETAFLAHMNEWTLEGKPESDRYSLRDDSPICTKTNWHLPSWCSFTS